MKRKNFNLNQIFTYNNLYESYKSVCKSCRSKYKKTFFSFFLYSNLTDILNSLKDDTYNIVVRSLIYDSSLLGYLVCICKDLINVDDVNNIKNTVIDLLT